MTTTSHPTPEIGKTVDAAGIATNYLEAGSGETVILIHGSGPGVSAYANWRLAIPSLASSFRVVAYDQVGFGYSTLPVDGRYSLDRWLEHLVGVMDALQIEQADLVGNSMGAAVALAAAIEHPARVNRLVLMGSMGVRFPLVPNEGIDAVWGYTPSVTNMKRLIDLFAYDRAIVTDELAELRYRASVRPGVQEAFSNMFPAPRQQGIDDLARYQARLGSIRHEALIVHGREDRVIPLETSLQLIKALPNAQLHVFGNCGHWTQTERAAEFNELTSRFLSGPESSSTDDGRR